MSALYLSKGGEELPDVHLPELLDVHEGEPVQAAVWPVGDVKSELSIADLRCFFKSCFQVSLTDSK